MENISAREAFDNATYKQAADKIRQLLSAIRNNPATSAKRWVWELMQNAKDIPNKFGKVSVEIELVSENELQFRHNGDPFVINNITGLIRQVSSKDSLNSDEEISGKFGTGFICTHLLSDIIDVTGILNYKGFRRFYLSLDRSGRSSEELMPRIKDVERVFLEPEKHFDEIPNYDGNRYEFDYDTVFKYHLTSPEKLDSAEAGLDDLVNTLPITLVTQAQKIKQVHVIDRVRGTDVTYICNSQKLDDFVTFSEIMINSETKQYLSYITSEIALTIEVKMKDEGYSLLKRDSEQPVLYRDFPLIGSEHFYFPYTLNGFRFYPTEKRNSIPLNGEDNEEAKDNRKIIEHAIDSAIHFNEWLIEHHAENRYLIASSRRPKAEVEYDERIALPWIKELQLNWRKKLLDQDLLETSDGFFPLKDISIPSFPSESNTKANNEAFFDLLDDGYYIGRGHLPLKNHHQGWLDVIRNEYKAWGISLKYEKENFLSDLSEIGSLSALCAKIDKEEKDVLTWLNKVYKFLIEQNCINDFDQYAIIPNQNGKFKLLKDLRSDHTSRIPSILKDIYNSVNLKTSSIQNILMEPQIDASVFGNTLLPFSLKEMIEVLNEYIIKGNTIFIDNVSKNQKEIVAYSILSLYPISEDLSYIEKRKKIYEFCCAYKKMQPYSSLEITNTDLWKEADKYWFTNSFKGIANKQKISNVASLFFITAKTVEDTLKWLNDYLQFYRENSYGDIIKTQSVFPNQQLELKELKDVRYDDNIPEEFKSLANYAHDGIGNHDIYRHQLLHRTIIGYEKHNPLTLKEIYEYVKKQFDSSNDNIKEIIARHTITIIKKAEEGEPDEKKIYDFAKTISAKSFEEAKYVEIQTGFNWGFAQEYYLRLVCNRIANSINEEGLRNLSNDFIGKDHREMVTWLDSLIEFFYSYKNKKFWPIVTDKDKGIGIWMNQNTNFCKFQDIRKDDNIPEELKTIAKTNKHIAHDWGEELFTLESSKASYLTTVPLTITDVGEDIDSKIESYDGDKQDKDFAALVFEIGKLCNTIQGLEGIMKYYSSNKDSLIVGSLGKGETMTLVGSIIQQGEDKIKAVKDILDGNSLEDLKTIKTILQRCPTEQIEKVKELVDKIATGETIDAGGETPTGGDDKVVPKVELVPETFEIEVIDFEGNKQKVKTDQVQYAGLSLEEIENYVSEAKAAVVKYFRELDERKQLGLKFDTERISEHSYSQLYGISDKDGNEFPIVVHSYKGPQYRYFDLNWYDWQLLSKPGSMLWVLTTSGLQCIPLYALPIRNYTFNLDNMSSDNRAALLTLAAVGKKALEDNNRSLRISFEFGNIMPYGFVNPVSFDYVPKAIKDCVDSLKQICDRNIPSIANLYNTGSSIPLIRSSIGYSLSLKELNKQEEEGTMRDTFEAPANKLEPPAIGAGLLSTL